MQLDGSDNIQQVGTCTPWQHQRCHTHSWQVISCDPALHQNATQKSNMPPITLVSSLDAENEMGPK
jgi:hypothetical protein